MGSGNHATISTSRKTALDSLYTKYNRREFVHPDPLEFLYRYQEIRGREVVALIASSLAFGCVGQILKSVGAVLEPMGASPNAFLSGASRETLSEIFAQFKYRFVAGEELVALLSGLERSSREHGSLNDCFLAGLKDSDENVLPALNMFVRQLTADGDCGYLVPLPEKGSACKRLNLFLRWMVRKDKVDPGGWHGVPRAKLIVPLDTHMARIGRCLGLTRRKSNDIKTALEITAAFKALHPEDPVRYDFALTRFGIHPGFDLDQLRQQL